MKGLSKWRVAAAGLLALFVLPLAPGSGWSFSEEELLGTWFVLIHYKNSETANPDADRWEDKIWTFKKKGSRLEWTEYPIVVFADQTGRFERTLGQRSRVLAAWQPNAAQQAQIDAGLEINSRGSKSKTLRGSLEKGYASAGRLRTQSASIIGYMENWSISGGPDKPVFARDDMMGSGRTEDMEGRTQYATQEILDDGRLLRGAYDRDGIRKGTFQMMKAAGVTRVAGKSEKVKAERQRLFMEGVQRQIAEDAEASGTPMSQEQRAATQYIFSLPAKERDELLKKLDGRSSAAQERIMRQHFEKLPPEEQQRLLDLSSPQASVRNYTKGMKLKEGLEVLHQLAGGVGTQVAVQKLEVLRLGADGDEEIAYEDIESGKYVASEDEAYGVLAQLFCSGDRGNRVSATAWQVYANNGLVAWESTIFRDGCALQQTVAPAPLAFAHLENRVTGHIGKDFPSAPVMKIALYRRALQTLQQGRVADAEALLAKADASLDAADQGIAGSRRAASRARVTSASDRDALRKQLVEAISLAKQGGGASSDLAPEELVVVVQERMVARYIETLPAQEQVKLYRELQGRRKDVQVGILRERIEALPEAEREKLYREALADPADQ